MTGIEFTEIREQMGLIQAELCSMLEISRPTLSRIENCERVPRVYQYSIQLLKIKQRRLELRDAFEETLKALR